jgi:hypothetical protein
MRLDFIFSVWLDIWFLLYFFRITAYSPKFAFCIAMIFFLISTIYLIYRRAKCYSIYKYIVINIVIKLIPLVIMRKIRKRDIICTLVLFVIYMLWLDLNNQNVFLIYNDIFQCYMKGKNANSIENLYDAIVKGFGV